MRSQIEVKWQGRTFPVDITEEDLDTCTVLALKEKCSRFTGLPVENMKLLAYGAVMKDNNAPLGHYGVRPGAKLRLLGSTSDKINKVNQPKTPHSAERQSVEDLQRILDKLKKTVIPDIDTYEAQVKSYNQTNKDNQGQDILVKKGLYFAETLMQLLFEFDGVKCGQGFDTARQLRKEGVNTAQELLDKVDRLRNSIK